MDWCCLRMLSQQWEERWWRWSRPLRWSWFRGILGIGEHCLLEAGRPHDNHLVLSALGVGEGVLLGHWRCLWVWGNRFRQNHGLVRKKAKGASVGILDLWAIYETQDNMKRVKSVSMKIHDSVMDSLYNGTSVDVDIDVLFTRQRGRSYCRQSAQGALAGSYLAVTALQIQHHLVSTLLRFHTLKLQKKIPNSELSA